MKTNYMLIAVLSAATSFVSFASAASAQDDLFKKEPLSFTAEPTLFDSADSDSTTLGLKYEFKGDIFASAGGDNGTFQEGDDFVRRFGGAKLSYSGAGAIAASADRNPENLVEFELQLKGERGRQRSHGMDFEHFIYSYGAFIKYETDQSFENQQTVYGGQLALTVSGPLKDDQLFVSVAYGQVDPSEDKQRASALGTSELESFYRAEYFVDYYIKTDWDVVRTVDLIYQSYSENDAPLPIKTAGLDKFNMATVRLGLGDQMFFAYSSGKLPFDKEDDDIFKLGFSFKLK